MKPTVSLRHALEDSELLAGALPGPSWQLWRILLIAAMGEPLNDSERVLFAELTGRDAEPGEPVEELWAIVGRRAGKTRAAATLGVYVACLCDHSAALAPGERGVLPILAASMTQATRVYNSFVGILRHSPLLAHEIDGEPTADTIRLRAGIDIEIRPANYRTIRGVTAIAAIGDEVAFWSVEGSSNPDREILDALRPALATTGGPLIGISTPYAKRGELYDAFRKHHGVSGNPILVVKGASRTFNPTLPQAVIDRAYERDPAAAASEYGGEFRSDVEAFISLEVVETTVAPDRHEMPPSPGISYVAFVDPSGGSQDSFTLAITHREGDIGVLDCLREVRPPFSPESVVQEFAQTLKAYRVSKVTGDRYAGEWPRERFRMHRIEYVPSEKSKSDIYREVLPLLNARRVELLDHPRLIMQLASLERRTARGGRDSIDHPPGAHDDVANAVAGALVMVASCQAFEFTPDMAQQIAAWPKNRSGFPYSREKFPFTWNNGVRE